MENYIKIPSTLQAFENTGTRETLTSNGRSAFILVVIFISLDFYILSVNISGVNSISVFRVLIILFSVC